MSKNKNILIKGNKITIKNLVLEDVYKMRQWGIHDNPLLIGYNFPNYTDKDIVTWYNYKTKPFYNKYFSIYLEDRLIGYLGMKKISRIFRRSTLGIVLDPNFINKGYGTDVLVTFLNYYFYELNMKKMYLDVDLFNKRALNLYLKLGFEIIGKYLARFIDDYVDVNGSYYLENENAFVIKNYKVYNYRYMMLLKKDNFKQKV